MAGSFELSDACEALIEVDGLTVFIDPSGVERAVFLIDENQDPLPNCDPNRFGYALTGINFIDGNEGVAICEVVNVEDWIAFGKSWGLQVVEDL